VDHSGEEYATLRRHRLHYVEVPDPASLDPLPSGLDLAAISSYSAQIAEAYDLARRFRAAGVPTVIGGPHVTGLPGMWKPFFFCDLGFLVCFAWAWAALGRNA